MNSKNMDEGRNLINMRKGEARLEVALTDKDTRGEGSVLYLFMGGSYTGYKNLNQITLLFFW